MPPPLPQPLFWSGLASYPILEGMRRYDDETPWPRQLLVVLGVLVAVALVIGGVVSVLALGAAKVSGVGETSAATGPPPSLSMPSGEPTVGLEPYPPPSGRSTRTPSGSASASPTRTAEPDPFTLQAFPARVGTGQRINLTGIYRAGGGSQLRVQRFEAGRWTDFPVNATVRGGQFATYVTTSRTGRQRFRMLDLATGKSSEAARVTVG